MHLYNYTRYTVTHLHTRTCMRNVHKGEKHTNNTQIFGLIVGVIQFVVGAFLVILCAQRDPDILCIVLGCWVYTS
jgi:hypothetical protein